MPRLNDRERATMLAALRLWQHMRGGPSTQEFAAIACDDGRLDPLTDGEISDLCERLNTEED